MTQVPPQKAPSASLYVGDLLPEVSEGVLFDIFSTVGPVSSVRVCRDVSSRRSLGYAYVNFSSVNDAERALATLNNTPINNKPCRLMWCQRDPTVRRLGIGNVFIKNLDPSITHTKLYDLFSEFGNILSCKVAVNEQGESKGYGFVHFESQKSAELATQKVNDTQLGSPTAPKKVFVGPFIPRKVRNQQMEGSWTNVFVKDIDPSVSDAEFEALFTPFGSVTSPVIVRKEGQPTFHGFVNFANHEDAVKAVEGLHGKVVNGKALFCCRAQKKSERRNKLRREWEQQKLNKYQGINLYVKQLEDDIDEDRLRKEFSIFGNILSLKIMQEDGISKGFGFICFENPEEANRAVNEMNGKPLPGGRIPLFVAFHEPFELRRQKLAQRHAAKAVRQAGPQGAQAGPIYGAPVYYPGSGGFPYPPQQMVPPMQARAWPPQYGQPIPTNYVGVPRAGGGSRGRGGAAQRAGGQSRKGQRHQAEVDPLSLQFLTMHPYEQQKLLIGERLYPLIASVQPELAGKITGMFLDSGWSIEELFSLLSSEAKLTEKIQEAVNVLEASSTAEAPKESGQA